MNHNKIFKELFELINSDEFIKTSRTDFKAFKCNKYMNFRDIIYFMLFRGKDNTGIKLDRYAQLYYNYNIRLIAYKYFD
ncbi:MAG: hypothetical protein LBR15_02060 [Methanobrevibacter sp.]|jgi:hypothetical protein|nr:hypothetical protein [Candidatus Methanovirga australis]